MRPFLSVFFLVVFSGFAGAGPWPRAEGETFVFVGQEVHPDGWSTIYLERGAARELTFGLSAGGRLAAMAAAGWSMPEEGGLRVFLRKPIQWRPGTGARANLSPWLFAAQAAAELDRDADGSSNPRLALGLSAGRSFGTAWGDGWTSLDLWISDGPGAEARIRIEAVAGLKATPRLTFEMGIFGEFTDTTTVTFAPTVQFDLGRAGAARIGIATNTDLTALTIGWVRTF